MDLFATYCDSKLVKGLNMVDTCMGCMGGDEDEKMA